MSQRNYNRFHVLENESSSDSEDPNTDFEIMSMENPSSPPSLSSSLSLFEKVYIRTVGLKTSTQLSVILKTLDTGFRTSVTALLDSGATGLFLDVKFVKYHNLNTRKLSRAIPVYNVDKTFNKGGSIHKEVDLIMVFNNHTEKATFAVCDLGDTHLALFA